MQSGLIASVALNYSSSFTLKCFWFPSVSDYGAESSCALQIVSLIIHTLMWVRLGCISECGNSKHMMTSLNSKNSMCKLTKGLSLKSYYQILSSSECWQCVFDLIHEPQKTGSLISLSVSGRGHTLCLHRKCLYLKIPYLMAPAVTEGEIVCATRSKCCFGCMQVSNINSILWNLMVFPTGWNCVVITAWSYWLGKWQSREKYSRCFIFCPQLGSWQ